MKLEQMKIEFSDFERQCLLNEWEHDVVKVKKLWRKAKTRSEFLQFLKDDEDLRYCHATGVLFKNSFYFIREMIGDRQFKTVSDAGGVRIRDGALSVVVPNGRGDGVSRVAVFEAGERFNLDALNYWTLVEGEFDICEYDCGEDMTAARRVHAGRWQVFYGEGFVVFKEIR